MLACGRCGAPVETRPEGGLFQCAYCDAHMQVAPRNEAADVEAARHAEASADDEAARFASLRAQAAEARPLTPPLSLQHYLGGGFLRAEARDRAVSEWRESLAAAQGGAGFQARERAYWLALMLSQSEDDPTKKRMLLETTLEVAEERDHKQSLRCLLSRHAARVGDLPSARAWLAPVDPRATDLHLDTSYRTTAAFLRTVEGKPRAVLELLGERFGAVPISVGQLELAGVLRANALEHTGRIQAAIDELVQTSRQSGGGRAFLARVIARNAPVSLCAASFPEAASQLDDPPAGAVSAPGAVGCGAIAMLVTGFVLVGIGALFLTGSELLPVERTGPAWLFGLLCPALGLLLWAMSILAIRRRARRARIISGGHAGSAEVLSTESAEAAGSGPRPVTMVLRVTVPGQTPYEVTVRRTVSASDAAELQPGLTFAVRVDPTDPKELVINPP